MLLNRYEAKFHYFIRNTFASWRYSAWNVLYLHLIVGVEDFVYFLDVESDVAMSVRPVVTGKTLEWFLARVDPQVLSQLRVYQELFTTMGANEIASLLMNALEIEFSSIKPIPVTTDILEILTYSSLSNKQYQSGYYFF